MQNIFFALLSGILLFFSFPPFEYDYLAWVALFPLILLSFSSSPGESFRHGLTAGLVFWLTSIFWLTKVTYLGWFLVSLYSALYFALFAFIISWWWNLRRSNYNGAISVTCSGRFVIPAKAGIQKKETLDSRLHGNDREKDSLRFDKSFRSPDLILFLGIPAIWVGLEYVRATLLTGFPWNLVGVSQYANINLIQCAEYGGVYLVSFLIMLGNTAVALCAINRGGRAFRPIIFPLIFLFVIFAVLAAGKWRQNNVPPVRDSIKAAGIQLNVPQEYKWSEDAVNDIYHRLKEATRKAGNTRPLDLIVWPETSLPDFVQYSGPSRTIVNDGLRAGVPLLAGSMDYEELSDKTNYFNSSFLYMPGGEEPQIYAKRHLVLFGEYVPCGRYLPFLRSIADVGEDFTPGVSNVVFRLGGRTRPFSVLICFEDTLPYLARDCVRGGARLLINQTNDAWFDPYWACRQHMTHCIFRCVENRVACLRVTNTGLTCLIDRFGRICSELEPLRGELRAPEILNAKVDFSPESMPLTFYTRHGDIFAIACFAFTLPIFLGGLISLIREKKKQQAGAPGCGVESRL